MLTIGVIDRSRLENEQRLPIHPDHFVTLSGAVRAAMRFETGYGRSLGVADEQLIRDFGGVASREELLASSDVVLLAKPVVDDLREMRPGAALWGWPHLVQSSEMTQVAIDRRLTLIAWEAMYSWRSGGVRDSHIFDRNNELAGYAGVIQALGLTGRDGHYGPPSAVCILSHGSVSRGAIYALQARGFQTLTAYTQRPPWAVHDKILGCRYAQMLRGEGNAGARVVEEGGGERPLVEALAGADLIVNGILQDTDRPLMFLGAGEEHRLRRGALIVDISCDRGMGFPFARPTTLAEPLIEVDPILYYGVDHSPSYLWRSATWELSRGITPFIEAVLGGPVAWQANETLLRAIEIDNGVIRSPQILSFQHRSPDYPHPVSRPASKR